MELKKLNFTAVNPVSLCRYTTWYYQKELQNYLQKTRLFIKLLLKVFCKKSVLKHFTKFIAKHQWQSLFLIDLQSYCL